MAAWADNLDRILKARGLKQADFARLVGEDPSFINRILKSAKQKNADTCYKPPLDKLTVWADKLRLEGVEREKFIDLGLYEHSPDLLVERYRDALSELARMRRALEEALVRLPPSGG